MRALDDIFGGPILGTVTWVAGVTVGYGLLSWVCWIIGKGGA